MFMKIRILLLQVLFALPFIINAQDKQDFGIKFSGFVKSDFFYDTRQNITIREGHFLLYPCPVLNDSANRDINAQGNFNYLAIQSRLSGKITGPDAFGAKTSGLIEGDFFGNENGNFSDVNGFRLRHAFLKMNWANMELLMGQYWNPLFVTGCFPGVSSFNTGAPIQPFSRNPQVRLTYKMDNLSLIAALASQRDFTSPGGSTALRNSGTPDVHLQAQYGTKDETTELFVGGGGEFKTLRPRLQSNALGKVYKIKETVGSFSALAYVNYKIPVVTAKLYALFGQNTYDLVMLGGYAVDTIIDAATGECSYTPVNILSTWFELSTNGNKIQYGLFAGYTKNMGTAKELGFKNNANIINALSATSRGYNIASVMRVAPRVVFISEKVKLIFELEYTSAAYATKTDGKLDIDTFGKITKSESVSNIRALFSAIYSF